MHFRRVHAVIFPLLFLSDSVSKIITTMLNNADEKEKVNRLEKAFICNPGKSNINASALIITLKIFSIRKYFIL